MRDDSEQRRHRRRGNRSALLGLFAVFTVPIVVAYALNVWWPQWSPFGRMNHGEIIAPAWEIDLAAMGHQDVADRIDGRWVLLHPVAARCDDTCEALLDLTRRVHLSLGKDLDRVVRMYVHRAGAPVDRAGSPDDGLIPVQAPAAWFDRFAADGTVLLVVDPQRNAILKYRADLEGKGLSRDLARVLKISKIG